MSQITQKDSWPVGRTSGACTACGVVMPPGAVCYAALAEAPPGVTLPEGAPAETPPAPAEKGKDEPAAEKSPFIRVDFCESCWTAGRRPETPLEMFSYWKTTVPTPQQKKKLLVDDAVLVDLFTRLEGKEDAQDVRFRFVLALILMRKRLLRYEGSEPMPAEPDRQGPPPERWTMVPRGGAEPVTVINPQLRPEEISEVSQQLTQILAEEI